MKTTSAKKHDVWVLSIHDRAPQGFLAFDLKEILTCLGSTVQGYSWLVTELDCTGEEAQPLCEDVARGTKVVLSTDELLAASEKFFQTIDATLFGIPGDGNGADNLSALSHVESFPEAQAEIVIRAVDSAFFEVMTKNLDHVRALQTCFKDVRTEEADRYFASSGDQ